MDTTTLVAALLHDTVEDTPYTLDDASADFGEEVAHLVDGVTKLDKVNFGDAAEAETIRKMIIAMAQDPRVLVIKLADRLHNMRTMRFLPPEKQARKARETLEVLAPLAHRLGMATVKWELEDLAFAILHSKRYDEIVRLVADRAPSRDTYLAAVTGRTGRRAVRGEDPGRGGRPGQALLLDLPEDAGPRARVRRDPRPGRGPHPGRHRPRVLRRDGCRARPVGADARPVQGLHRAAPVRGVPVVAHHGDRAGGQAARGADPHLRHAPHRRVRHRRRTGGTRRPGAPTPGAGASVDEMAWMRQLLDWQREAGDPGEFLDNLRYEMASSEIFVFTPKGDIHTLPAGSTPVDFAYSVHTEVGNRCIGAKVDGRLVPLERQAVQRADRRDLHLQGAERRAEPGLAVFVASSRAKTKIRQYFAKAAPRGGGRGSARRPSPRPPAGRDCRCSG